MATTERAEMAAGRERVAVYVVAGLLAAGAIAAFAAFLGRPPQMGTDEDVFRTVDALYTAVRLKDEKKLGECEARLHAHRDAGKLPAGPAKFLDGVIGKARAGKWETATETLYEFMLAQRRDGAAGDHREPKPDPKAKPARGRP
jgi:hypothetical protein